MPHLPLQIGPYTFKKPLLYTIGLFYDCPNKNEAYPYYEVTIPLRRPHPVCFICDSLDELPSLLLDTLNSYVGNPPDEPMTSGALALREELCSLLSTP